MRCRPFRRETFVFHSRFEGECKEKVDRFDDFAEIIGLGFDFADKGFPFLLHRIVVIERHYLFELLCGEGVRAILKGLFQIILITEE